MKIVVLPILAMAWCAHAQTTFTIDFSQRAQTIENIGSSTGMHGDYIAKHWKPETVDAIVDLLFGLGFDEHGSPKGIGLSCFRIQIGGGAEGEASGLHTPYRRTDCFLRPDGSYDWNNGQGTRYWRKKAEEYGVPTVIGYLNSPPVYFTGSGYTFKTNETFTANLEPEHYGDYAAFLATVAKHFQTVGLPFDYISPVNEPQWFWSSTPGKAKQEGSPWSNEQIARLVRLTDAEFRANGVKTMLLIPEAASYDALSKPLRGQPYAAATDQICAFWSRRSPDYVGNLQSLGKIVAGHAYFSDNSIDKMISTRRAVKDVLEETASSLRFWQTEYSLLGEGWTGGLPKESVDEMAAALLVARNIHVDFTLANATAWQWWSSTEPTLGKVPRFCLIECDPKGTESYRATKLLWALGHYSRFVRPGMVRIPVESDVPLEKSLKEVMASAFYDAEQHRWVMVCVNISDKEQKVEFETRMLPMSGRPRETVGFLTSRDGDMQRFDVEGTRVTLPPRSMATLVSGLKK